MATKINITKNSLEAKEDFTELTRQLSEEWMHIVESKFAAEGIPTWKPLSPATLKERNRKGYTGKILQRTNLLQSSVMPYFTRTTAGVGTNLKYALAHEQPNNSGDYLVVNIPARQRVLNFKKYKSGKHKGKALFSKEKKASYSQKVNISGYLIKIPKRPFIKLNEEDKQALGQIIINFLGNSIS